jgi:hypothetical protein
MYCETHVLLDELAAAGAEGTRREYMDSIASLHQLMRSGDDVAPLRYSCRGSQCDENRRGMASRMQ